MAQRGQTAALCITTCCRESDSAGPACAWGCFCSQELVPAESAVWQDTGSDLLAMQVADPSRQRASGCLLPCVCREQILLLACGHDISGFRGAARARPEGDLAGATPWAGRAW